MGQTEDQHDYPQPPQEGPGIHMMMVMALLAGTLMTFAFAVLVTFVIMKDRRATLSPEWPRIPHQLGDPSIAEVNQLPFTLDTRATELRREDQERLSGYGWVNRKKGVVHIPVDKAIDEELQQQAKGTQR